ncbi:MAG TPA: helix-turn-helix transcriptional regulator [Ideonella sp.]|nr:helix-turn-helix transcriptional regulator [Ideonella sp.]
MQHWTVGSSEGDLAVNVGATVRLIGALGAKDSTALAGAMLEAVRRHVQVHHCSVMCFEGDRNPRLLSAASVQCQWQVFNIGSVYSHDHYLKDDLQRLIHRYPASFESPTVIVHRQSLADIDDADYRAACYQSIGIVERVSVLIRVGRSQSLSVNFYRDQAAGLYSDADVQYLIGLAPLLASCAGRHYALDTHGVSKFRGAVNDELADLCPCLTAREREVVQRILDGATTERIADELKIRPTTVITYRARAYDKIGVNSRRELFAALLGRQGGMRDEADALPVAA